MSKSRFLGPKITLPPGFSGCYPPLHPSFHPSTAPSNLYHLNLFYISTIAIFFFPSFSSPLTCSLEFKPSSFSFFSLALIPWTFFFTPSRCFPPSFPLLPCNQISFHFFFFFCLSSTLS
ncbi:hypothetical protein T439DRAFT_144009 [Meredithblackwellia eburnea MCA 4105]